MAKTENIADLIQEKAFKDLDRLNTALTISYNKFNDNIGAAIQFNNALGGSKSLKDFDTNSTKAALAMERLNKAQAQTALVELRVSQAREKAAIAYDKQVQKQLILEEKRSKAIVSNSAAEVKAAEHSTTGNLRLRTAINEVDKANIAAANSAAAHTSSVKLGTDATNKSNLSKKQQAFLLAEEKLNLQKSTAELKNQVREANAVKGSLEQRRAALIRLSAAYDNLSAAERNSSQGLRLQGVVSGLTTQVKTLEAATGRAQRNVGNYGNAFTKGVGKAFSIVRQLAYILPGVGIAGIIGFATEPIINYISSLNLFKKKLSEAAVAGKTLGEAFASSDYVAAVKNVNELTINIGLAKQGLLSKDGVLKQYNETIGLTTGQVTSLDEAERSLTKNGTAYIQMTLMKAAAQIALDEAAKKAFEAAQKRNQNDEDVLGSVDSYLLSNPKVAAIRKKAADRRRKESSDALIKEKDTLLGIAKTFQTEAAGISLQFKGGLFGSAADDDKAAAERLKKQQEANKKRLAAAERARKEAEAAKKKEMSDMEEMFNSQINAAKDADSKLLQDLKTNLSEKQEALSGAADDELVLVAGQYAAGEIKQEEYAQKRLDIQRQLTKDLINEEIKAVEFIIGLQRKSGDEEGAVKSEKELSDLKRKLSKETASQQIEDLEKVAEKEKELLDKRKELNKEVGQLAISIVEGMFARQTEILEKQSEQIDIKKAQDIEAAEKSIGTEEEKAARIKLIEARAQGQKEAIERKQRQISLEKARFDRLANIAGIIGNTARGVTAALPNIPLSVIVGLIGAAQLGQVLASPIPKYKDGVSSSNEGPAWVGDGYKHELQIDPDGKAHITPNTPTLTYLKKGTKIIGGNDFQRMLTTPEKINYVGGQAIDINALIASQENSTKQLKEAYTGYKPKTPIITEGAMKHMAKVSGRWSNYSSKNFN
jgi:hypothetical protein